MASEDWFYQESTRVHIPAYRIRSRCVATRYRAPPITGDGLLRAMIAQEGCSTVAGYASACDGRSNSTGMVVDSTTITVGDVFQDAASHYGDRTLVIDTAAGGDDLVS